MNIHRLLGRSANKFLGEWGLELIPRTLDFDARLTSATHVTRLIDTLARGTQEWLDAQSIIFGAAPFDVHAEIDSFLADYLRSPFRNPRGGSRFGNLLWLDLLAKTANPSLIIDSGTYTGASAWALSRGAPAAKVVSFDLDLSRVLLRSPAVEYVEADWMTYGLSGVDTSRTVAYFDDHLDQGRRLREAAERKINLAIFDDDFSVLSFAAMANSGRALPKISFILDESLADGEVIEWSADGRDFTWKVDREELKHLRSLILADVRLPNIAAAVGIDQLPYRLVATAPWPSA